MADLSFLKARSRLQKEYWDWTGEAKNSEDGKKDNTSRYEIYFNKFYPFCLESLQKSIAIKKRDGDLPEYHSFVIALPLIPEPAVLLSNALTPTSKIWYLETDDSKKSAGIWLNERLPAKVATQSISIEGFGFEQMRELLQRIHQETKGRLLVDLTGGKKSTAANIVLSLSGLKDIDFCYLDGMISPGALYSNRPAPGTEKLIFWNADDVHRIRETAVSFDGIEQITIHRRGEDGFEFGFRQGGRWEKIHSASFSDIIMKEVERVSSLAALPKTDDLQKEGEMLFDQALPSLLKKQLKLLKENTVLELSGGSPEAHRFPWELLYFNNGFMGDRLLTCRKTDLPVTGRTVVQKKMIILSNPTGDPGLAASGEECQAVYRMAAKAFGTENVILLEGGEADCISVLKMLKECGMFHFSGHSSPKGLELADGLLTPDQIAASSFLPAFVWCNSCHSAAPELGMAFLQGGCRTYLGNRWELDDLAAGGYAVRFYNKLLGGETVRDALLGSGLPGYRFSVYGESYSIVGK